MTGSQDFLDRNKGTGSCCLQLIASMKWLRHFVAAHCLSLFSIAVTEFEGRPVADGKLGLGHHRLAALLQRDILENTAMYTPCF
ncbi:MAG: hypothetical protein EOL87_16480 [Spartobacteria bacterium]|nr:hypothetical protein [Spartobacteria bacterium]